MNFVIYDLNIINKVNNKQIKIKNNIKTEVDYTWEDLFIEIKDDIIIGFVNPEPDNSFDKNKENDYLYSLGLYCIYGVNYILINSFITNSNVIPGNINCFTIYAIIDNIVKKFNISRTVSRYKKEDSLNIEYIVNPITIESDWEYYKILNGNYIDKKPSILSITLN